MAVADRLGLLPRGRRVPGENHAGHLDHLRGNCDRHKADVAAGETPGGRRFRRRNQWARYGYIRSSWSSTISRIYSFQDVAEAIAVHPRSPNPS
jgi:hypothetical protein